MSLAEPMSEVDLAIEPFAEQHREPLRAACAEDREIWEVYPYSMLGEHFDPALNGRLGHPDWVVFVILVGGRVVGTTCYIAVDRHNRCVEIGGTYIAPHVRGTGLNARVKRLLLERAFASGFDRVQFNIDTRNARSMRAVEKIGGVLEGVLRKNRVTWTGYARDTAIYAILRAEWDARARD